MSCPPSRNKVDSYFFLEMESWSEEEVCTWLESLDMTELIPSFRRNAISGAELVVLDNDELRALGVSKVGQRRKILNLVNPDESNV